MEWDGYMFSRDAMMSFGFHSYSPKSLAGGSQFEKCCTISLREEEHMTLIDTINLRSFSALRIFLGISFRCASSWKCYRYANAHKAERRGSILEWSCPAWGGRGGRGGRRKQKIFIKAQIYYSVYSLCIFTFSLHRFDWSG
jgi:hypothetical protein